jgi:hypothetical protein
MKLISRKLKEIISSKIILTKIMMRKNRKIYKLVRFRLVLKTRKKT